MLNVLVFSVNFFLSLLKWITRNRLRNRTWFSVLSTLEFVSIPKQLYVNYVFCKTLKY